MTNKITIKYKNKEYEIEKTAKEQKVKPKNPKTDDKEITVKDYQENKWNHTCSCSENGTDFEKVEIKWGTAKHITIWGTSSIVLMGMLFLIYWLFYRQTEQD